MEEKDFLEDMKGSFGHKFAKKPEVIEGNMKGFGTCFKRGSKYNNRFVSLRYVPNLTQERRL